MYVLLYHDLAMYNVNYAFAKTYFCIIIHTKICFICIIIHTDIYIYIYIYPFCIVYIISCKDENPYSYTYVFFYFSIKEILPTFKEVLKSL